MQFEFEGSHYRIVFSYDKSRDWAAHRWHEVALRSTYRTTGADTSLKGQPELWCTKCNLQLSHLHKSARKRLVRCTLFCLAREEPPRDPAAWESIAYGVGRVNLKAGDQFSRKEGREAALANMLDNIPYPLFGKVAAERRAFRAAAWTAYNKRKEAGPFRREQGQAG